MKKLVIAVLIVASATQSFVATNAQAQSAPGVIEPLPLPLPKLPPPPPPPPNGCEYLADGRLVCFQF